MAGRGRDQGRSVTSRVLAVLAAFDDSHPRLRLSEVARITGGGMADIVVEAVGHADQAINLALGLVKKFGRLLYFGVPPERIDGVHWRDAFVRNVTIHTSVNPDFERDFPLPPRQIRRYQGVDVSIDAKMFASVNGRSSGDQRRNDNDRPRMARAARHDRDDSKL